MIVPLLILGLLSATPEGAPPSTAAAAFAAGEFPRAAEAYAAELTANPADFDALVRLAALRLYSEDLDGAQAFLERAAALQPDSPRLSGLRATLLGRRDVRGSLANATLAGAEARVPFVAAEPLPLVTVSVNGHDALFVVDTGAPDIVLDPAFAQELGIATTAAGTGTFAGGKTGTVQHAVVDRFAAGVATVRAMPATVSPTRMVPFFPGRRVDGILGTGFFMRFTSTIDYPHAQLVFRPRGAQASPPSAIVVPFWLVGDHFLFARGRVNDAPEALMLIDTGLAGGGLAPTKATIDAAHIALDTQHADTGIGGGGNVAIVPFTAARVQLGAAVVHDVPGLYTPEGTPFAIFPFTTGGAVSHDFLKHFTLTFDFVRMHLVLTPAS